MAFVRHAMGSLVHVDPGEARARLTRAFVQARAHRGDAARVLGCRYATFCKWCALVGVDLDALERRAKTEGWHHGREGGKPYQRGGRLHRARRAA